MSLSDDSRILIEDSEVMPKSVASLTDDSVGISYNCKMFIVQPQFCSLARVNFPYVDC
jgi:hypothetical protein